MNRCIRPILCIACALILPGIAGCEKGKVASAPPRKENHPTSQGEFRVERDVAYLGPKRAEKADLYIPSRIAPGQRLSAIIVIHGGAWSIC